MSRIELFGRVSAAIEAVLGPDAPVDRIGLDGQRDATLQVFLTTPQPGPARLVDQGPPPDLLRRGGRLIFGGGCS